MEKFSPIQKVWSIHLLREMFDKEKYSIREKSVIHKAGSAVFSSLENQIYNDSIFDEKSLIAVSVSGVKWKEI